MADSAARAMGKAQPVEKTQALCIIPHEIQSSESRHPKDQLNIEFEKFKHQLKDTKGNRQNAVTNVREGIDMRFLVAPKKFRAGNPQQY